MGVRVPEECGKELDYQVYCGLRPKHRGECREQSAVYDEQRADLRQQLVTVTAERDRCLEELTHVDKVRLRAIHAEIDRDELRAQRDKLAACLEECCPDGDGEGLYEWGLYAHRDDPPEQDAWTDKAQALHDRARALLAEVRGR